MKVLKEPLTFELALEYFGGKIPVSRDEFDKLLGEYKQKAFTVSGYSSMEIIRKFHSDLQKSMKEGLTNKEFRDNMNDFLLRRGYDPLTPFQSDNIFRTNTQSSYNAGHYKAASSPAVMKYRPYLMYDAVDDRHTRDQHKGLDGKVYRTDHPFWDIWMPPNGYRCRCGAITLSESQVKARGLKVETEIPKMVEIQPGVAVPLISEVGFDTNPAKVDFTPDLSKYPPVMKEVFEKHLKSPLTQ